MKFKRSTKAGQALEMICNAVNPLADEGCFSSLIHFNDETLIAGSSGYIQSIRISIANLEEGSYMVDLQNSEINLEKQSACNNFNIPEPEKSSFKIIEASNDSLPGIVGAISGKVFNASSILNSVFLGEEKSMKIDDQTGILFIKTQSKESQTLAAIAPSELSSELNKIISDSRSVENPISREKMQDISSLPILKRNTEKNGIELRWNERPSSKILAILKLSPFRWNSRAEGKPWWAKYSEENFIFAQNLATKSEEEIIKIYQTTLSK